MKFEEQRACEFLKTIGFSNIQFEPDGNVPPDFLVDGKIAIEVRRLNQYFGKDSESEPLEKLEFKLIPKLFRLINEINVNDFSHSVAVMIRFHRPLTINKSLLEKIKNLLIASVGKVEHALQLNCSENLRIDLRPLSQKQKMYYVFYGYSDYDGGGLLHSILYQGLKTSIIEKQKKIIKYFNKYPEWWLILVDRIGFSYSETDLLHLKELDPINNSFKKIFVISPYNNSTYINYK